SSSKPTAASGCPVDHGAANKDEINPLNMMPNLTQEMHQDQKQKLSTERELSSIPRATPDTEEVWEYPSPQQFYNALARKNMAAPEEYVDVMVDIHNFLNEGAWNEQVRYVIDYYEGHAQGDMPAFNLVVRPAIDDFGSLADRAKQLWRDAKEKYFSGSESK
ncbi:holocytochrome c synthase, partial [Coemansia sp. RSA 2598]